jgi:hypothetical protein
LEINNRSDSIVKILMAAGAPDWDTFHLQNFAAKKCRICMSPHGILARGGRGATTEAAFYESAEGSYILIFEFHFKI